MKWLDWKYGLFSFFEKNCRNISRPIGGLKKDHVNSGDWAQTALVLLPAVLFTFLVLNASIFVNSGYLDKKFVILWHSYLRSQTAWANIPHVVAEYNQFIPFLICSKNTPNNWSWGVLFDTRIKVFMGGLYHAWFLVYVWPRIIFYSPMDKNLLRHWFIDRANMLTNLIIPQTS